MKSSYAQVFFNQQIEQMEQIFLVFVWRKSAKSA